MTGRAYPLKLLVSDLLMNALTQTMLVLLVFGARRLTIDFSDTLIARRRKQSYRTSRQDGTSTPETLEEKMARVKREVEEIRVEMANKGVGEHDSTQAEEWDKLIHSFNGDENATSRLTSRVKKIPGPPATTTPSTVSPFIPPC